MAAIASRYMPGPASRAPNAATSLAAPPFFGANQASAATVRKVVQSSKPVLQDYKAAIPNSVERTRCEVFDNIASGGAVSSTAVASASTGQHGNSAGGGASVAASSNGELQPREYKVYVESILRPLRPESLLAAAKARGGSGVGNREGCSVSGRQLLEEALSRFVMQLRGFVTGCDDRKLSKAALRRARGIEAQLGPMSERILAALLQAEVLRPDDMHGIWHGFSVVRGWRDVRVPQECILQMLRGALAELDDDEADDFTNDALTWELTLPEVHQAMSVSAWPPLCELLGRLPDCVTPAEIQEALWQQSFVENPTHAPDHRNYRRFAMLAAQMVAIGVELESGKVELLVQQTLELDRPWRERRDMLSGILSAASVEDKQRVVRHLDRRFEEHADIDDFEIVCGIAETVGVEIPRDGAIRRCALRRWALDAKRGGALPVARLIDFVDCDATIGEDVANSLRAKGRVADAALLLARLPHEIGLGGGDCRGMLDVSNGDAELARLREVLAQEDNTLDGQGVFQPMEESAFRVPLAWLDNVHFAETADAVVEAVDRLKGSKLLGINFWKEEAPFWYSPITLIGLCSEDRVELIDLVAVRNDISGGWPNAANQLRELISDPTMLKVYYGEDYPQMICFALGLGVANTLKHGDREVVGPSLNLQAVVSDMLGTAIAESVGDVEPWSRVARRYLGIRLCPEEAGSNWSRRPLRVSQLHHAAAESWTQIPVLRAVCGYGIIPRSIAVRHLTIQEKVRIHNVRLKLGKGHALGQIAPVGRLAEAAASFGFGISPEQAALAAKEEKSKTDGDGANSASSTTLPNPTRIATLSEAIPPSTSEDGQELQELLEGTFVEVFEERFGSFATVAALTDLGTRRRIPTAAINAVNSWSQSASWVAALPRPSEERMQNKVEPPAEPQGRRRGERRLSTVCKELSEQRVELADELVDSLYDVQIAQQLLQAMYDAQETLVQVRLTDR